MQLIHTHGKEYIQLAQGESDLKVGKEIIELANILATIDIHAIIRIGDIFNAAAFLADAKKLANLILTPREVE